jgi:plastocyanin
VRRVLAISIAAVWAAFATVPVAAAAASYSGTLAQPGVAWISDGSKPAAQPDVEMRNTHKAFVPDVLVITAGTSVRFPNDDPFFHSIYSESGPDQFDIGFYDNGPGKLVPFGKPGVDLVRCHIHGTMHGTIVIVDGPSAQTHAPGARYTLNDVRAGTHTLHIWMPDTGETTSSVRL